MSKINFIDKLEIRLEKLEKENAELRGLIDKIDNCQIGDFVVYHPTVDPDATNIFDTMNDLKSKLDKAIECLKITADEGDPMSKICLKEIGVE
jgi:hypothetical protein